MFTADGELAGTTNITGIIAPPGRMYRLSDGGWVVGSGDGFTTAQLRGNAEPGVHRLESPIVRLSRDGTRVDATGVFPSAEVEVVVDGPRTVFTSALFGRKLSYAVWNDQLFVGTADRLAVDVYSPTGRLLRSVRAPEVDVRWTEEIEAAHREYVRERIASAAPERRPDLESRLVGRELPQTVPAYTSLLVDQQGNLWLGEFRIDHRTPRHFLVFDRDGRFMTGITVPPDFRVLMIPHGQVRGRATDDLGVQYVVGCSIVRDSG
ncbi:MAG TPA: hypothetical protein VF188_02500 [Longimicrobiales bacterium]